MANFDGLWELRMWYTTIPAGLPAMQHRLTVDVNIAGTPAKGDLFDDINITRHGGGTATLKVVTDEFVALLTPLFGTTATIDRAELWYIPEGTYDAEFYSTYSIAAAGTGGATTSPAHQGTLTFRSLGGSVMRIQLMESAMTLNNRDPFPSAVTSVNALFNYVVGLQGWFLARDNTRPFAAMALTGGQNEALFRKRYR